MGVDDGSSLLSLTELQSTIDSVPSSTSVVAEHTANMEHDLTSKISEFLDRHMVMPLLDFFDKNPDMAGIYKQEDIMKAKLELISNTNMVDYAIDIHTELYGTDPPEELVKRREMVLIVMEALQDEARPLLQILNDDKRMAELMESGKFTMDHLAEEYGINDEVLDAMYEYGKFQFDCGNYELAAEIMHMYRVLMNGRKPEREFFALWGKLASNILVYNWDAALEDLNALKDVIDSSGRSVQLNPLQQLQQRTWLIHWSLFVFFNHENGRNGIADLLFSEKYLNTIQTNCPHILRYLTTAVITNKRRRNAMKDLVKVIQQESYAYSDPITEFVQCLYVNFDFEGAQDMLQKCEDTLKRDFFLCGTVDDFLEDARLTIFETYCRIHQVIDIDMLATKLNMDRDEAEKWVVNLIRNARLDAKINSQANQVIMGVTVPSVYEQVIESTKSLMIRASVLSQNCDRVAMGGGYSRGDDDRRGRRGGRGGRGGRRDGQRAN